MAATKVDQQIAEVVRLIGGSKDANPIDLIKKYPAVAAGISKLSIDRRRPPMHDNHGNRSVAPGNEGNLHQISQAITEKTKNNESAFQLFPELDLAAQILISSILSPKNMMDTELTYSAGDKLKIPEIKAALLARIKLYLDTDYKIGDQLHMFLERMLFKSGSVPVLVMPENSIDDAINGKAYISKESIASYTNEQTGFLKNLGILGNSEHHASFNKDGGKIVPVLEFFKNEEPSFPSTYSYDKSLVLKNKASKRIDFGVSVVDNVFVLTKPKLEKYLTGLRIDSILNGSKSLTAVTESNKQQLTDRELTSLLYKVNNNQEKRAVKIKTDDELTRKTIGAPLIQILPSESVIPVTKPGDETDHVCYFILLDGDGNFLNRNSQVNHFGDLQTKLRSQTNDMSAFLMERASTALGTSCTDITIDQAAQVYADVVEADLLSRLRNGIYGNDVSISRNDEVYRIMLARTFANQNTQLLCVPEKLMSYFAYKRNSQGIGVSMMDDMQVINSLRAMVMMAKVNNELRNSISITDVKVKFDELDPSPLKTLETAIHEITKQGQGSIPVGLTSPSDIADWMQKASYKVSWEEHPALPATSFEFGETSKNHVLPSSDLEEDLRKRQIMTMGLNVETVDNAAGGADFATTLVQNNLQLSKRVTQIQNQFTPTVSDLLRKIILNHGDLMEDLRQIVDNDFDKIKSGLDKDVLERVDSSRASICKILVTEFVNSFEAFLPSADSIGIAKLKESFDDYLVAVDEALQYYVSDEMFPSDTVGESVSAKAGEIRTALKSYLARKWMADNNFLPEMAEITTTGEDGKPLLDLVRIHADHIQSLSKTTIEFVNRTFKVGLAADKDIDNITGGTELEQTDSSTTTPSSGSDDSESNTGGADDFGDFDMEGGEDTPSDETDSDIPPDLPALGDL